MTLFQYSDYILQPTASNKMRLSMLSGYGLSRFLNVFFNFAGYIIILEGRKIANGEMMTMFCLLTVL
jgi:hypothetical protein